MNKKKILLLAGTFLLICMMLVGVIIKNKRFNSYEHKLEFSDNILKPDAVKDDFISVRICPRGFETGEYGAWYHSFYKDGEDPEGKPHNSAGTIYELMIVNNSDDIVSDWSVRVYFPTNMMFNSGWNGDFELHQYVDESEKTFLFKDSKFGIEGLNLDYIYYQSVLLIPVHKGDYFDYIPSTASHEVPVAASDLSTDERTNKTIGFIVYKENGNIEDVYAFPRGYVTYRMHRSLFKETAFYFVCVAFWIWFMFAFIMFIVGHKMRNMEKEKKAMEEMVHKFELDGLTGIYTRQAFFHYADQALLDKEKDYGVAIVEIDNFKMTYNQYGDSICNEYLEYLAGRLKEMFPEGFVGRFSRTRFSVFTEINDDEKIDPEEIISEKILDKSPMPNQVLKVGVYQPIEKDITIRRCCDRVLLALSDIRGKYGQNISVYDDKLESRLMDEHKIIECMEEALRSNQFKVYYQPKNDAMTGRVSGAEALVRWIHPEYGFMSPGQFIPIFEQTGFITKLDAFVFERVCRDILEWKEKGRKLLPVSINISRKDFFEEGWIEQRCEFVEKKGIDNSLIHLEVTESLYAEDTDIIRRKIDWVKDKGYQIEMDDFGSGYSSLGMLAGISLDVLKLDISFMKNIDVTDAVVESIIDLAHKLNLKTIAEGVETEKQYDTIKKLGCDYIQGYYFSKPLPKAEFEEYISNN